MATVCRHAASRFCWRLIHTGHISSPNRDHLCVLAAAPSRSRRHPRIINARSLSTECSKPAPMTSKLDTRGHLRHSRARQGAHMGHRPSAPFPFRTFPAFQLLRLQRACSATPHRARFAAGFDSTCSVERRPLATVCHARPRPLSPSPLPGPGWLSERVGSWSATRSSQSPW